MNFPRRQMMRPPQPEQRNFGTDLHAFMDGLSRIVQIAYSSLPIIAFVKVAIKYAWKFCLHLGSSFTGGFSGNKQLAEATLEGLWRVPSIRGSMVKLAALALALLLLYRTGRTSDDSDLEEAWEASEHREESLPIIPRSEEDRVFPDEVHEFPVEEEDEYDYEEYPIDFY